MFVLFELLRGELAAEKALPATFFPLVFFYLDASLLAALSRRRNPVAEGVKLILLALSLTILDQVIKAAVRANLPYQASLPLIEGCLHLAHERNLAGPWLVDTFSLQCVNTAVLMIFTVFFLLGALIYYR